MKGGTLAIGKDRILSELNISGSELIGVRLEGDAIFFDFEGDVLFVAGRRIETLEVKEGDPLPLLTATARMVADSEEYEVHHR